MQRMTSAALLLWTMIAGLPMSGQVLNDQISFQVNGIEWKSTYDGDNGIQHIDPFHLLIDDFNAEENTVQIWLRSNQVDLTPKLCVAWDAKNYSNAHRSLTEASYDNVAIGVIQNTHYHGFNALIDYWEDDAGNRCTYDLEDFPAVPNGDDGYVIERVLKDYSWQNSLQMVTTNDYWYGVKDKPQGEWHTHPDKGTSLQFFGSQEGGVTIRLATNWNYTHGNTITDPLNFGTIPPNSVREHINKNVDAPGTTLGYTDTYGNSTRDVFYRFVLAEDVNNVNINTNFYSYPPNGSTTEIDTRLILLDEQHNVVADVDNLTGFFPNQARMSFGNLCAGAYYVVVEGGNNSPEPKEGRFKLQISTGNGTPLATVNASQWTVFAYDEVNTDNPGKLRGVFTVNDLRVNTDDFYAANGDYGNIASFAPHACSPYKHLTGSDYFSHVYRRKFTCGRYGIRLDYLDDSIRIVVDGAIVYENFALGAHQGVVWSGQVNDEVAIYHTELTGPEKIDFEVIPRYSADWIAHFYRNFDGQFAGVHPMNYGYSDPEIKGVAFRPTFTGFSYHPITASPFFTPGCANVANNLGINDYHMEYAKYSFTPGVYAVKVEADQNCSDCNYRLFINAQLIYHNGSYPNPIYVYLDEYSQLSLVHDTGGFSTPSGVPYYTHRGISARPQANISDFLDITQDKTTIYPCDSATFSVQKNNGLNHIAGRIQWQQSTDGGNNWSDIPDAHAEQYTLGGFSTIGTTRHVRYRLTDRKALITFTSSALQVTVIADPSLQTGTTIGPTQSPQCQPIATALSVSNASNTYTQYQWQESTDGAHFHDILGATQANYTPSVVLQATYYRRINFLSCGYNNSSTPLQVTTSPNPNPLTGGQIPAYNELMPCAQTTLSVSGLAGAQSGLAYQWQASTDSINWSNLPNANTSTLTATYLSYDQYYRCIVTNVCGETTTTAHGLVKPIDDSPPSSSGWSIGVRQNGAFIGKGQDPTLSISNLDGASLAILPNYTGCAAPADNYQVTYRRTGWPCDDYSFQLTSFAANPTSAVHLRIDEDGDGNWDYTATNSVGFGFNYTGPGPFLYLTLNGTAFDHTATLNNASIVEVEVTEPTTDPYFANNGLIISKSLGIIVTPQGNTASLTAGTATGDETLFFCTVPSAITVTGTTASTALTYQWQASTDGGNNWSNIAGATSADYSPAPLAQTTAFRRMTVDLCSNVAYTNAVVKTVNALPVEGVTGNGIWNAYAYTGQNFDTYTGHFTLPNASFNLTNEAMNADVNGNPAVAASYVGCPLPNDDWSVKLFRTGWSCGTYRFDFTDWDDHMTLRVDRDGDGHFEYSQSLTCCATNVSHSWNVDLNPSSVVAIEFQEVAGQAFLNLNVTQLSNGLVAGTATGDETANRCASLSAITVTGEAASSPLTYQWQASTDGGNNWSDLSGATAAIYTPQPLNTTTAFRRKATDVCSNATFTNAVTKTINPLPTEGGAGNGTWNAYAYTGQNFDTYTGHFTLLNAGFNLTNEAMNADVNGNPSVAASYVGCSLPNDYWSVKLFRTGWNCGTYRFEFTDWNDHLTLRVDRDGDGHFEYSQSLACCATGASHAWNVDLNPNSIVAIEFQEAVGQAFLNLDITQLSNGLVAGTASGDETTNPCVPLSAITVAGTSASTAVTYQWQASTDGGNNWTNIAGATAATYTPQPLVTTTAFRRMTVDLCGNTAPTNAVVKTINPLSTEGDAGNGVWYGYGYDGANTYLGFYTLPSLNIDLAQAMGSAMDSPSSIAGYSGCSIPVDNFTTALYRTGWGCGTHRFYFSFWSGTTLFLIDQQGDGQYETTHTLAPNQYTPGGTYWDVNLNPNAVIKIVFVDIGGPAMLNLTITPPNSGLVGGTATGDETADACATLSGITVTGATPSNPVTYQWQASTDGGSNWTDIPGATAANYAPHPLSITTAFRRKAMDACGNIAFSNAVTKTIHPFSPQSIAGTATGDETADACATLSGITVTGATPSSPVTYQWQASTDGGSNWTDIPGATAANYAPHPLSITTAFRRKAMDECGNAAFSNAVTKTINPFSPQSIAGTATGDETADACATLSVITVTSATPSSPVTYQWQASTDGGSNWSDIAGATAANYTPQPLLATTAFRRKAMDACGNTAFSNTVTKNIDPLPAEGTPGDGVWHGYGYDGASTYLGFYTLPNLNIDLAQAMSSAMDSPSSIAGYSGCPIPVDGFTAVLYRTGWHCGTHRFYFSFWSGSVVFLIDIQGDGQYETTHFLSPNQYTPGGTYWDVDLNPNAVIGIAFVDIGGPAMLNLTVTPPNNGLLAGTASGQETADACALLSSITVTGDAADSPVTYQWQASTDGGNNWIDIAGATAANYTPQSLNITTAFRRKATDGCSRVFTNAVTKTINPLPTEGLAGSATWYGYAYEGDWGAYRGRFSASSTDLQLSSIGLSANVATAQPADIGTYVGCATDPEVFSVRLLRRHWTPAHYTFALADIDGNAQIAIDTDGDGAWEYLSANLDAPASNLWAGVLDSNAVVRIEYQDDAGVSRLHVTASSAALPVELLHFEASIDDDRKTRLHWATASELQNEGFEIERSTDGLTWEVIGWMPGQGTTQERTDYFHWDEAPHDGVNYYRLHQRDYDGTGAYSPIRSVQYDHSPKGQMPIAFPNPVTSGTLTLLHAQGRVTLSSALGQPLQHWRIDTDEARIDLSTFPKGAYWLSVVRSDGQVTTLRILK